MSILVLTRWLTSAFAQSSFQFPWTYVSPISAIANQESLSGLETEMRKIEGQLKEIIDEMNYLKTREERFTKTNRASFLLFT